MNAARWQWIAALWLVTVSLVLYAVHFLIFKDSRHIFFWSLTSLAFLPISVLFVTLIINRLLTDRACRARLQKMNMVIGTFFSEVGNELLGMLAEWDENVDALRPLLTIRGDWEQKDYAESARRLAGHAYNVDPERLDLVAAKEFLSSRKTSLLRLLENPNLLEHEASTALLPETDVTHLAGDFRRAYAVLARQWFEYLRFIKKACPYLFSLAIRTNPLDRGATPIVR
jgi:hypothetical protein